MGRYAKQTAVQRLRPQFALHHAPAASGHAQGDFSSSGQPHSQLANRFWLAGRNTGLFISPVYVCAYMYMYIYRWVDAIPVMQHFDMLDQRGAGKLCAEDLELTHLYSPTCSLTPACLPTPSLPTPTCLRTYLLTQVRRRPRAHRGARVPERGAVAATQASRGDRLACGG